MDNYMRIVKDNRATGELDHPDDSVINLKNVSHMITECWWEGKDVMGKIKVLDTPSGRILKDLINAGVKLGISSRGLGSVKESMGDTVVEEDFQLICFDIVAEPSTPDAYVAPRNTSRGMNRGAMKFKIAEGKENKIENQETKSKKPKTKVKNAKTRHHKHHSPDHPPTMQAVKPDQTRHHRHLSPDHSPTMQAIRPTRTRHVWWVGQ